MKTDYYLGIDTSNYTTSAAVADGAGRILLNAKRPLPVRPGECGLRQSDAVFAHTKNLPSLMEEVREFLHGERPTAIGVSETPRKQPGSYMPCFLSGVAAASAAAASTGAPLYRFSHQCGHLMAAIYSSGREDLLTRPFAAFHVSGGTTEALSVSYSEQEGGFSVELCGGTADLSAGQAIDRAGVMMGLPFPAGPALEELAARYEGKPTRPRVSVNELRANLSGLENLATKMYRESGDAAKVAAFVLDFVAATLSALTKGILERCGDRPILYAGGVMANRRIRAALSPLGDTAFAEPAFSADNAAGIALLCRRRHGGLQ